MPLTLKFSAKANRDLNEIFDYLNRRSPPGAKAVVRAIERSCLLLSANPHSARRTDKEGVRVRPLSNYPYLIFHSVEGEYLYIIHVRHSARRPVSQSELER